MAESFGEFVRANVKCCSCEKPLTDCENINMVNLDKFVSWDFPAWGNILAKDPDKKGFNRAMAIVCDNCVNPETRVVQPIKFALEVADIEGTKYVYYHEAEKLKDAPPIMPEDIEKPPLLFGDKEAEG